VDSGLLTVTQVTAHLGRKSRAHTAELLIACRVPCVLVPRGEHGGAEHYYRLEDIDRAKDSLDHPPETSDQRRERRMAEFAAHLEDLRRDARELRDLIVQPGLRLAATP